jgi:hypothetical protein
MTAKRYAYWSDQYVSRGHRTQVWSTPDGKEIEACFVLATATPPSSWSDIKHLGEVVVWLRHGQRSIVPPLERGT